MYSKLMKKLSTAWIDWLNHERPHEAIPLCDFERIRYELRPCDVLLIEGRSRVSDIIRSITQSSWSHAALYLGRLHDIEDPEMRALVSSHFQGSPDTQLVIEGIMGKGAIISALSVYQFDHIRVCRPRGLFRQDSQHIISHAIQRLGYEYDVRQVVDLARFMLPWRLFPRRFRSKLFLEHAGDNTKIVCSTMIAEAFASVEFPILPLVKTHTTTGYELIARNPKLYTPRDFDYSPYFDIMKYPYIEFADYAQYRKLPWNREGLVSHDRVGVRTVKSKANPSFADAAFAPAQKIDQKMNNNELEAAEPFDAYVTDPDTSDTYLVDLDPDVSSDVSSNVSSDVSAAVNSDLSSAVNSDVNSQASSKLSSSSSSVFSILKKKPVETPPTP